VSSQGGREHPSQDLRQNPATEHSSGLRTKTQEGTFLASENRERPSGPLPISTCRRDTVTGVVGAPAHSTFVLLKELERQVLAVVGPGFEKASAGGFCGVED